MKTEIEVLEEIDKTKSQIRKVKNDNPKSDAWLRAYWKALSWVVGR